MNKKLKHVLIFSLIFLVVDQLVKLIINNNISLNEPINIINNFFSINLVYNSGAAFSILSGNRVFLILIEISTLIGLIYYIDKYEKLNKINILIYSLLIGGIAGNLIDRIVYGYVIDYISFKFGNYFFPTFNLADTFIVISVIFIILSILKEEVWKYK